jgi:dUTP pyrophosphatase
MKIPVVRLDPDLPIPAHAMPGDAGVDLRARDAGKIAEGERAQVRTGIAVAIPEGFVGLVSPRSGLAIRHGISVVNGPGVIDSGYRGEVAVILINHGDETFAWERGDRIGQLVVVPHVVFEAEEVDDLAPTDRAGGGFGSTGS